jgi:hypothetical protein
LLVYRLNVSALRFVGVPDNDANRFVRWEKFMAEHKTAARLGEEVSAFQFGRYGGNSILR